MAKKTCRCVVRHDTGSKASRRASRQPRFGFRPGPRHEAESAEAVLAAYQAGGNDEYEQIRVIAEAEVAAFLAEIGEALVPPAREFMVRAGLANREAQSSR